MELDGATAETSRTVAATDTATAVGSGNVRVLGTPVLLAWMEAVTVAAVAERLPEGMTSVGSRVELRHLAPTPVGDQLRLQAAVVSQAERTVTFEVSAQSSTGETVGVATIDRILVDLARFELRAGV